MKILFSPKNQPLMITLANAIIVAIISFGIDLSTNQIGAIMTAINAATALVITVTYRNGNGKSDVPKA